MKPIGFDILVKKDDAGGGVSNSGDLSGSDLSSKGGIKLPEQAQRINTPVKPRKKRFYSGGLDK
jgi:hypothetical protein